MTVTVGLTVGIAVLWVFVALLRPGTTLHLGPVLVPLIPLVIAPRESHASRSAVLAAVIAVAVTAGLATTGNLDGPALTPFPNALVESGVGIAVGAALGLAGTRSARRVMARRLPETDSPR